VTPSNPSTAPDADAGPAYLRSQDLPLPRPLGHHRSHTQGSTDTLGSNFTVEEETRLRTDEDDVVVIMPTRQPSLGQHEEGEDHERQGHDHDIPRSPCSMERIEAGSELIHVPQVADKRYSWEESQRGTLS
jgi:hypothetical protein